MRTAPRATPSPTPIFAPFDRPSLLFTSAVAETVGVDTVEDGEAVAEAMLVFRDDEDVALEDEADDTLDVEKATVDNCASIDAGCVATDVTPSVAPAMAPLPTSESVSAHPAGKLQSVNCLSSCRGENARVPFFVIV